MGSDFHNFPQFNLASEDSRGMGGISVRVRPVSICRHSKMLASSASVTTGFVGTLTRGGLIALTCACIANLLVLEARAGEWVGKCNEGKASLLFSSVEEPRCESGQLLQQQPAPSSRPGLTGGVEPPPLLPQGRRKVIVPSLASIYSHMRFMGRQADVLAEAGDEVHLLIFDFNPQLANETGSHNKEVRIIRPTLPRYSQSSSSSPTSSPFDEIPVLHQPFKGYSWNTLTDGSMANYKKLLKEFCAEALSALKSSGLIEQLAAEHYDVGVAEVHRYCFFGLFHRLGVRNVVASSTLPMEPSTLALFGVPTFPGWFTHPAAPTLTKAEEWGFLERASNFGLLLYDHFERNRIYALHDELFTAAFGPNSTCLSPLKEVMRNISLLFHNSNPLFELPQLPSAKVIPIGGIMEEEAEEKEAEKKGERRAIKQQVPTTKSTRFKSERLGEIVAQSKSGVVLISFGSAIDPRLMSSRMRDAFLHAFSAFPTYDFVWKYPGGAASTVESTLPNATSTNPLPANVHFFDWVEQRALLHHPKTRAFLSHCGRNSVTEAAWAGVPVLALPLFNDMPYNAAVVVNKGVGVYLDVRRAVDAEPIIDAMRKLLENPSYAHSAQRLAHSLRATSFKPTERFVHWVKIAADHGGTLNEALNLPYHEFNFLTYYSVDVVLVVAVVIVSMFLLSLLARRWLKRGARNVGA